MTEEQADRAVLVKDVGLMLVMVGTAVPGANEPLGQMAAKGYLRVTKGVNWRSYYNSFSEGTPRLRLNFRPRRELFRQGNSTGAIQYGEFAATTEATSPVNAITRNALHPSLTGNRARLQYSVVPRRQFYLYIEGEVAGQGGAFVGGNTQVLILRTGSKPVFLLEKPVFYTGTK